MARSGSEQRLPISPDDTWQISPASRKLDIGAPSTPFLTRWRQNMQVIRPNFSRRTGRSSAPEIEQIAPAVFRTSNRSNGGTASAHQNPMKIPMRPNPGGRSSGLRVSYPHRDADPLSLNTQAAIAKLLCPAQDYRGGNEWK